jgi:adenosylcobinamide-GDP ribazoletransferase
LMPWYGIAAGILPAAAALWWLKRLFARRLGGYTGDCLGAVQQVTEVAFYLGVLAVVPR